MNHFFESPAAQAILWSSALGGMLVIGFYLIGKARAMRYERPQSASELMTDFRDLHTKGELSDEEFRTIKGMLAERLQRELMRNGGEG